MFNSPLIFDKSGPIATSPENIRQEIIDIIESENPGYTASLPASMIEDLLGTSNASVVQMDQGRVEAVNNITPYAANEYILDQQGLMFGIPQGLSSNASVYIIISGDAGYVIVPGFTVSDGTNQYIVINGGTIGSLGTTPPLYCVAKNPGSFAIPANTVNTIITSIPAGYTLTCDNPNAGVASKEAEGTNEYKARIMQAMIVTTQGVPAYIRTLLYKVGGVVPRLVSPNQTSTGLQIVCGGGDPYQIAGAIYQAVLDITFLIGSLINPARNITATIIDVPNTYDIVFVDPPQQNVEVSIVWNTTLPNFTSGEQVNQLSAIAVTNYINSIVVGRSINTLQIVSVFKTSVADILSPEYVTSFTVIVKINSVVTPPNAGTNIIPGDPESYFFASQSAVTVVQGS